MQTLERANDDYPSTRINRDQTDSSRERGEQPRDALLGAAINRQSFDSGYGTPETFVEALQGALYMDDMGLDGNILYVKRDSNIFGDKSLGWIAV